MKAIRYAQDKLSQLPKNLILYNLTFKPRQKKMKTVIKRKKLSFYIIQQTWGYFHMNIVSHL